MPVVTLDYLNTKINDTYVDGANASSTTGYTSSTLAISASTGTSKQRSFLKFDLGLIPNNAIINSATLRLMESSGSGSNRLIEVKRISSDWVDSSTSWNAQPAVDETVRSSILVTTTIGTYDFDVKSLVQDWVNGTYTNYGFSLTDSQEATQSWSTNFVSSDGTAADRPKLIIDYTIPSTDKKQVELVSSANLAGTAPSGTTATITLPTTQANDYVLIQMIINSNTTVTTPTGWTKMFDNVNQGSNFRHLVFTKFVVAGEPNPSFTAGVAVTWYVHQSVFRNVKANKYGSMGLPNNVTAWEPGVSPSVTVDNTLLVVLNASSNAVTFTPPINYAEAHDAQNGGTTWQLMTRYMHKLRSQTSADMRATASTISYGSSSVIMLEPKVNTAPNAPSNLNPSGTSTTPASVATLTPTLSWSFTDPDTGNTQSAYQVIVKDNAGTTTIHDSGKVLSGSTSYTVPAAANLQPNTQYQYTVTVWDNNDAVSPASTAQYFKTTQAPTATPTSPTGTSTSPAGASQTPRLSWTYSDPEAHAQAKYQLLITRASDLVVVHDTGLVTSANAYYDVPAAVLAAGVTYYWALKVEDSTAMQSAYTANQYFLTNTPPPVPTLNSPVDTYRTSKRPVFEFTSGDYVENDSQSFILQLATDSGFTAGLQTLDSTVSSAGWEYFDGTAWQPLPIGGKVAAVDIESKKVRYTMQSDLVEGTTYYWKAAAVDGTTATASAYTASRTIRCGNVLQFQGKTAINTTAAAARIVFSAVKTLPIDGTVPASIKVEACNNGLDAAPTWEDATAAFNNGNYHGFTNTVKTALDWAVNYRVTINANDSLDAIEIDAIGFSFD